MGKRPKREIENLSELLPGMEWLATHNDFDDGDTYTIHSGRVAEYVEARDALVIRQGGKEIGFIPMFVRKR